MLKTTLKTDLGDAMSATVDCPLAFAKCIATQGDLIRGNKKIIQ
jgi:hypothetical protein